MKNWLRKLIPAVLLLVVLNETAWAQTRVATVDLRKLFDGYWKRKQADTALKDRAADLDKEFKGMRDDHKKLTGEYQKLLADANDPAVSAEEREKRKKAAETKLKDIQEAQETLGQFERQARTTLDEQMRRMRDNVLGEIRTVINAKAKSAGYALVVDTAAESKDFTPICLYSSGENDLTQAVLEQLNATAPVETAKPSENKEEKKDAKKK
ncbi:MAG TPA: OmpH family outer membrane protein [Verrucomicrobiae bacterium]|nr:OmpH family outer membrane protein [Verrucomicrobiae bacterium]